MQLSYYSKRIRKLAEKPEKKFDNTEAKKILQRIEELKAVDSLADAKKLITLKLHKLSGDRKGQYAIKVIGGKRIVFYPAGTYDENDISTITEIQIIEVNIDYH